MPSPGVNLDVKGLPELQAGLVDAQRSLGREMRRGNKEVATQVAQWSQQAARSGTRAQARFATAIQGRSTQRVARIAVTARGRNAGAAAVFFGARPRTRTGWNAAVYRSGVRVRGRRYLGGRPQHQPWVGNTWIGGRRGEGPYVINDTIARHLPDIDDLYADSHQRAVRRAFPEGSK